MFTLYNPKDQKWPIKVWLENAGQLEEDCLRQAKNLANLPFIHKWVALMPDTHSGYGMPIGGVITTRDVIIPNAVGVDIGCGMIFVQTNIPVEPLVTIATPHGKLAQTIINDIMRDIPTGFAHHKSKRACLAASDFLRKLSPEQRESMSQEMLANLDNAYFQVGTLGGGNHFIELQTDEQGYLGIMVHSGSRNVGYKICNYFNDRARELNRREHAPVPLEWDLAYLPTGSKLGMEYIRWMNLALDFAKENRARMLQVVMEKVSAKVGKYARIKDIEFSEPINCHHNYAAFEEHYGERVWVHRKGAIRAEKGEMGIIPGAMGACSYLVTGKGNPESYNSCSHGAGRRMSRSTAKKQFPVQDTIDDLKSLGVFLGKQKKYDVGEESRHAYKDIDFVISNELDLIEPKCRLKTIAVIKG
ncbi:RNA-splicing ligase RtcB [Sporotomaculum syntrophicum]|uniref:3'-phosphate/5'-hydroxy nucleic acid ligase n=1 Tax=Sporotomaculum syntrophicum TaxID=182264 RepID=A0A9D2WM54_9FIRM|nr:RtcB family protein [Sporotomaculum syntrophicum]KAF1084002.1 RNA-splicing ligase RtcB [Sporotomaculum syntrophicum]